MTNWGGPWSWQDVRDSKARRKTFSPSKAAERKYTRQLKSVAGRVSQILAKGPAGSEQALRDYAKALEPWANQAAANMVRSVATKNEQSWREASRRWGIDLKRFMASDVSSAVDARIKENVKLITSIPGQAADKVGSMAREALLKGGRADELTEKIAKLGQVAHSRAKVIALTEISKAGTALTRARAEGAGSEGYIWRTARDGGVRPSHAAMEGRFVRWDSPPTLDGMTGHAGEFPNDRCYPEPVVPDLSGETSPAPIPTQAEERRSGTHKLRSQWERLKASQVVPHLEGKPLHNVGDAKFVMDKLTRYSMDSGNPRGRDKARVWEAALGMDKSHAKDVKRQIMERLESRPAFRDTTDQHGERFTVLVPVTGPNGRTVDVTTAWIYKRANGSVSTKPRLVTAFIGR